MADVVVEDEVADAERRPKAPDGPAGTGDGVRRDTMATIATLDRDIA
ncbi:MAG: hypothetical protein M3Q10_13295 [Chloroflexota bacterium]|nr:hypothetical protein [Chloroflexota bacterium]